MEGAWIGLEKNAEYFQGLIPALCICRKQFSQLPRWSEEVVRMRIEVGLVLNYTTHYTAPCSAVSWC